MKRAILSDFNLTQLSTLKAKWQEHCNNSPDKSRWISVSPPEQQKGGTKCPIRINEQWLLQCGIRDNKEIICIHEMCEFVLKAATEYTDRDKLESYIKEKSNIQRNDIRGIRYLADKQLGLGQFAKEGPASLICSRPENRLGQGDVTSLASGGLPSHHAVEDNPVRQHNRVWDNLPSFVRRVEDVSPRGTKLSSCFDHIKDILRFGRIPHIYIDSGLHLGCGDSSLENADVLYFDQAGADHFLRTNPSLKGKVLVVRDKSSTASFQSFVSYHSQWPNRTVDIQDFSKDQAANNCVERVKFSSIVTDLQDPNPRLSLDRPPRNLLNLASRTYHPRPLCLTQDRFKLIDELAYEARCYATNSSGKTSDCISGNHIVTDFEDFELLSQAYTASKWHKDTAGAGTQLRCQSGVKLWPVAASLNDRQRDDFVSYGEDWRPNLHEVPVVVLFPGDTLIMLAGNDNVHAPITMEDCSMTGGMFWDSQNIHATLRQILQQDSIGRISNEPLQAQLRFIIQALYFRAVGGIFDKAVQNLCEDVLRTFSYCECTTRCSRACLCKTSGLDCTVACHDESSVCGNRGCPRTEKAVKRKRTDTGVS
jgi:hypothetical protein